MFGSFVLSLSIQYGTVGYGCVEFASEEYYKIYDDDTVTDKMIFKQDVDDCEKFEILANNLARNTLSVMNTIKLFVK